MRKERTTSTIYKLLLIHLRMIFLNILSFGIVPLLIPIILFIIIKKKLNSNIAFYINFALLVHGLDQHLTGEQQKKMKFFFSNQV